MGQVKKERPNTISRAVYYGASLLRDTVSAGDTDYANLHKVYTIWLCRHDLKFLDGSRDIRKCFGEDKFIYRHRYNLFRNFDEVSDQVMVVERESDLIEVVMHPLSVKADTTFTVV